MANYEVSFKGNAQGESGVAYRGDNATQAKAAVAALVGKCSQVFTKIDGVLQRKSPWYWDRYEQYQRNQVEGVGIEGWLRDAKNEGW